MIDDIKPPETQTNTVSNNDAQNTPANLAPNSETQKKVLCVEDEPFIADLYKRALIKAGYEAEVISDGLAGLERAKSNEFDIIILDIMIPQMLGIDILHELRKIDRFKAKIIIATNLEQDEETRKRIEQQADAYLIKAEITPAELVDFLGNF